MFERVDQGSSHRYRLDGREIPGVTTIIGALDKPALVEWAAKMSAQYAIDNWGRLGELDVIARYEEIRKARYATNRTAVVRGNRVHALAERLAHGEQVEAPPEIRPHVEEYARFLDRWELEPIWTESPVCNTAAQYAGTLDAVMWSPRLGTVMIDVKTGKGVYDEVALQLNAYAACDTLLASTEVVGPRGGKKPPIWTPHPMPDLEGLYVAHARADAVELHPIAYDQTIQDTFLFLREVFEGWIQRTNWKYRDTDFYSPTVSAPIYPEDRPYLEGNQK